MKTSTLIILVIIICLTLSLFTGVNNSPVMQISHVMLGGILAILLAWFIKKYHK